MLSYDIIKKIFSFNSPGVIKYHREYLTQEYQNALHQYQISQITSKEFSAIVATERKTLKQYLERVLKIKYFLSKYNYYQNDYEYYIKSITRPYHLGMLTKFDYNLNAPPFLYDSLLSGCELPYCKSSTFRINLQDVMDMIKYCPESVKYNMGYARCRNSVSPLWAISMNRSVDFRTKKQIINLLLECGATYKDRLFVNGNPISIENDIMGV